MSGGARRDVLLLTATIAPRAGAQLLHHVDPAARLADYLAALPFHLEQVERGVFAHLVLAENSGHPLDAFREAVERRGLADRVTLATVPARLPPGRSRFALELELLGEALRHPAVAALGDVRFWKLTGRYVVPNVAALVRTAPPAADGYFHSRTRPLRWTDFFIAAFTRACFERLLEANAAAFDARANGEEALFELVTSPPPPGLTVVPRMRRIPAISGVRGFDGRRYDDARGRVGHVVRSVANRVAPRLWI